MHNICLRCTIPKIVREEEGDVCPKNGKLYSKERKKHVIIIFVIP